MAIMDFNYNKAISQAKEIDNIAEDMLNVANKQMQNTVDSIGICWRGEASQQFVNYCESTQSDIRTQAKKLQDLARRIRDVARIIKDAENRAKELQRRQAAAEAAKRAASKNSSGGGGSSGGSGGGGRF